ncbi:MAG: bifunctional 3-deoxy-7-phosphoheptulonate synthase/chorismate mutase type II [Lentisphaeria bacterium]|nr:bifunctional 3-deoxy-7-phosphoheptulonate synthase/chorismate mutase type II [Lentisphaeria bacterium]
MKHDLNIIPLSEWGLSAPERPIVIAGPCSAESEEQMLATARGLMGTHVSMFRAGIWKPRTRPGSFEGVGSVGLAWLKTVKQETGFQTATEVANAGHVAEALEAEVDLLWVGARTTANPFAVQEIADALKGVDIPVLVKNPVNPDVDLWLGALERLNASGLKKLGAIHRGFSGVRKTIYRNEPLWQLPIELRQRAGNVPMFCDPSHISGKRDLVQDVCHRAMNLDYHGLMVETHVSPETALSDAAQQVTPARLTEILSHIVAKSVTSDDQVYRGKLDALRDDIDQFDQDLLDLLARRMEAALEIGRIKKQNNVTVYQAGRWDVVRNRMQEHAREHGLGEAFTDGLLKLIHQESINKQQELILDDE